MSADWMTELVMARRAAKRIDRHNYLGLEDSSMDWLTMAGKPRGGKTATMRRRATMLGVCAAIAGALALPSAAKAQSALAEPWRNPNGLHTDINGQLTDLPMRGCGGFGDGTSHPVGTVIGAKITGYGSMSGAAQLAAIQAYPYVSCQYATATTDEMDLLAFRTLAAKAIAAGGETIRPEAGVWMFSSPLPNAPAAYDTGVTGRQATYSIVGAGSPYCIFKMMNDVSTGYGSNFALQVANRTNADGTNYLGLWQGFTLVGPGTTISIGTKNCQLSGLGWGARRAMTDVHVMGFYQGICVQGDQTKFDRLLITNCSIGMEWDLANNILYGDFQIDRSEIVNCAFACVTASPVGQIPKVVWNKCIFATSPICFAKRVNTGASGWQPTFIYENVFLAPQFEQFGYAAVTEISDSTLLPNPTAGSYNANILVDVQMLRAEFGPLTTSYKFPTLNPSAGLFEGQNMLGQNTITLSNEPNLVPGSNGLLNVANFGGFNGFDKTTIEGDWDSVFGNLRAVTNTSGYARSLIVSAISDPEHLVLKSSIWAGKFFDDYAAINPPLNTYVALRDVGNTFAAVAGTTADGACGGGTVKFRRTDGSASAEPWILICTRGFTPVLTSNTWTGNQTVRTSASGGPVAASGPTDTTSYNLGVSYGAPSGGVVNVRLFEKFNWIDT